MTELKSKKLMSVTVEAGTQYEIDFKTDFKVDIINHTDDKLWIYTTRDMSEEKGIYISPDEAYNGLCVSGSKLYLEAAGSGDVCIVRVK